MYNHNITSSTLNYTVAAQIYLSLEVPFIWFQMPIS